MLDINKGGQITYKDTYPSLPNGNNVKSLVVNGQAVDFGDATKYYKVSTVNYLAAGSCNFSDGGVSLWPLNQIVYDTQYYVRDVVIDYMKAQTEPVAPVIEGRLQFMVCSVLDVVKDGVIDLNDINAVLFNSIFYGAAYDAKYDIVADGVVDIADVFAVSIHFGETCP